MAFCLVVGRTSVSEEPTGSVADAGIFFFGYFLFITSVSVIILC